MITFEELREYARHVGAGFGDLVPSFIDHVERLFHMKKAEEAAAAEREAQASADAQPSLIETPAETPAPTTAPVGQDPQEPA